MEVAGRKSEQDFSGLGSTEEDDGNLYCDPCENEGERQPAEGFCEDCQEYLCSSCYKVHRRPSVWRHHVLLDKHAMPKTKTKDKSSYECTEPCPEHSSKIIEYYCQTHDQLGCPVCITRDHRTCTDIDYIPQIAEGYGESTELNELLEVLEGLLEETGEYKAEANNETLKVSECEKKAKTVVLQIRDEFNTICDKLVEEIETVRRSDESEITQSIERFDDISNKIRARSAVLDKKREDMKLAQLFTDAKMSKSSVIDISRELKVARENARIQYYDVDFDLKTLREGLKLNFHENKSETVTGLEQCRPTDNQAIQSTRETNTDSGKVPEEQASNISRLLDDLQTLSNQTQNATFPRKRTQSPVFTSERKVYDRKFLLQFCSCAYAQKKPNHFPDIPDIILNKPTAVYPGGTSNEFNPKYVWTSPGKSKQVEKSSKQQPPVIPDIGSQQMNIQPQTTYPLYSSSTKTTLKPWMRGPSVMSNVLSYPGSPYFQPRPGQPPGFSRQPFMNLVSTCKLQFAQAYTASPTSNKVSAETNRKLDLTKKCNSSEMSEATVVAMLNDLIATKKEDNDAVIGWIERNVNAPITKEPGFIRALVTVICCNAIEGNRGQWRLEPKLIGERRDLLDRYIGGDSELELQSLHAVQALISKIGLPRDIFRGIFETLYAKDVIRKDAFFQWQNSEDETEGKDECLKGTKQFFTWLVEANDD